MKMYLYSVEWADGQPRKMFPTCEEAKAERLPHECVIEYTFSLEEREPVVWYNGIVFERDEELETNEEEEKKNEDITTDV